MLVLLEAARESLLEFGSLPPVIIIYAKDDEHVIVDIKSKTGKQTRQRIRKLTKKFRAEAACLTFTGFCAECNKSLYQQGILPEHHPERNEVLSVVGRDRNQSLLLIQMFSRTQDGLLFEEPIPVSPSESILSDCKLY